MAHHTEQVGFPEIPLAGGMIVRLRAISPTTDAAVTGVSASEWMIYGRDVSEALEAEELPRWVYTDEEAVTI